MHASNNVYDSESKVGTGQLLLFGQDQENESMY